MISRRLDARMLGTRDDYIVKLRQMGIRTLRDLLLYFPRTYRDEQDFTRVIDARTDEVNVLQGRLKSIFNIRTRTGKTVTKAVFQDETGELPVMWFNQSHLKEMFFKGSEIILTGKLKYERGRSMLMSPKYERPKKELLHTGRIVPVYPESEGVTSKWLREKIHKMLPYAQYIEDYMPKWVLEKEGLMALPEAIYHIHFAEDEEHLAKAKERLAFDELFILQFLALRRKKLWQQQYLHEDRSVPPEDIQDFLDVLPYELTGAQKRVVSEILTDIRKDHPMLRLVQGDVGSGKTVVAAAAIFAVQQSGMQTALMAPTEILAKQHYKGLMKLLAPFEMNIQLLTGSTGAAEKADVLRQMATGTCDLVIGTHSLIQEGVNFSNLGLAVVDEQHRFGVKQRDMLKVHGSPHILSLSATPIPRTMALTIYGDQDLSILDEMPPGRQEIVTRIVPEAKRNDSNFWVSDQVAKGRQVFVICPLVEESESIEVKAATKEYKRLSEAVFPQHRLALLHGRMKSENKDEVMRRFGAGEIDILVSTSVVEVGIDVPNATIMIIEGAERFGLAQLHQFRGRVGRGEHQSYCFLFTGSESPDGLRRLKYMVQYSSGFDLAEMDLMLRGPGEVFGIRQSGIPDLRFASLTDADFLMRVRERAVQLLENDIELASHPRFAMKIADIEAKAEKSQKS
jgi:ATP-dependent DNA helicase RecG